MICIFWKSRVYLDYSIATDNRQDGACRIEVADLGLRFPPENPFCHQRSGIIQIWIERIGRRTCWMTTTPDLTTSLLRLPGLFMLVPKSCVATVHSHARLVVCCCFRCAQKIYAEAYGTAKLEIQQCNQFCDWLLTLSAGMVVYLATTKPKSLSVNLGVRRYQTKCRRTLRVGTFQHLVVTPSALYQSKTMQIYYF